MVRLDEDLSHPRVMLRPCLLLLLAEEPGHGYDLVERLRSLGIDRDGAGPLYQILRRLEGAGLVTSAWDASEAGPARRTYRLTALGWDSLRASADALERLSGVLGDFRTRCQAAMASGPADGDAPGPAAAAPPPGSAPKPGDRRMIPFGPDADRERSSQ